MPNSSDKTGAIFAQLHAGTAEQGRYFCSCYEILSYENTHFHHSF